MNITPNIENNAVIIKVDNLFDNNGISDSATLCMTEISTPFSRDFAVYFYAELLRVNWKN